MKEYLLAHDLGTSGDKATLFTTEGELVDSEIESYPVHYYNGNWAEQDAEDWWNAFCASTRKLLARTGIQPERIRAVSFSGQMMGCLCVDREGKPLRPSIIWADQRAQQEAEEIEKAISQWEYYQITGHRNTASYGIQKLMWVKKHEPEVYRNTYKMLNAKDFMVQKLTGVFCTDYSDANGCGFFDLKKLDWSEELLKLSGIDRSKLPDVKPSTFCAGKITEEAARQTGLTKETAVIIGAGDGVATNVGAGSVSSGKTFCCMGTSAWITTTSEQPLLDPQMRTVTWAHMVPGLYAPNGTMQYAGGSYSWLKGFLNPEKKEGQGSVYEEMNREAEKSSPGAGGVTFLPYLLGERAPRWDPDAKGCFYGIQADTTRNDMIRSAVEGVVYNLSLILDILKTQMHIEEITVLGGGAKGEIWRKIMADVWETRIIVPELLDEAGAMGAAVNAGVGAGIFKDFSAIERFQKIKYIQQPDLQHRKEYHAAKTRFNEVYEAMKGVEHAYEKL